VARVWRRRRSLDTPRPAGRRWAARLVRGGSRATQVFARVTGRRRDSGISAAAGTQVVFPRPEGPDRSRRRAPRRVTAAPLAVPPLDPPVSAIPAMVPTVGLHGATTTGRDYGVEQAVPVTIPLLPGERTPLRRLQFAITNACTLGSLGLGMGAIFLAIHGDLWLAALAILACVALDGCDGGLARKFGVASPFGAQMDSMADLGSFGIATGVVSYLWLTSQGANPVAAGAACALLAACAAIRLARFNVSPKDGRFFCGVPTTMTAAVLALDIVIAPDLPAMYQVGLVAVYAIAMVSGFPYAKLSRVLRLPPWLFLLPAVCALISVQGTFLAVIIGYLLSGPVLWVVLRRRPALA
jgi:CDP-diacylglycerol--serine O-phosphatidyltransferase